MSLEGDIITGLQRFISRRSNKMPLVCVVKDQNETLNTCYCEPINGDAAITDVRLLASPGTGFVTIPKTDSIVIVAFIDDQNAYVAMFSEVLEININGDNYGGIARTDVLQTKLNNMENKFNALFTAFNSWVVVPNDGGLALKALLIPPLTTPFTPTTQIEISNSTVKNGDGT